MKKYFTCIINGFSGVELDDMFIPFLVEEVKPTFEDLLGFDETDTPEEIDELSTMFEDLITGKRIINPYYTFLKDSLRYSHCKEVTPDEIAQYLKILMGNQDYLNEYVKVINELELDNVIGKTEEQKTQEAIQFIEKFKKNRRNK